MIGKVSPLAQNQAACLRVTGRSAVLRNFLHSGLKWKPAGETTFLLASRLPIKLEGPQCSEYNGSDTVSRSAEIMDRTPGKCAFQKTNSSP